MTQRITIHEGQTAAAARLQFDGRLGVSAWATPGQAMGKAELRDPAAPWWWVSAEEASDSFLTAMGVKL